MSRRRFTPSEPLSIEQLQKHRRSGGGARHEASERLLLRHGPIEVIAWTLNVSRGGVRLIVEDPVEPGTEYEVVTHDGPVRRGKVVWVQDEADGQVVGVQFVDVDEAQEPPASEPPPEAPPDGS